MRSTFTKKALLACIACGLSSAAVASSFTNHAGHVVSGQLVSLTNGVAVIGSRAYPLSVFPDSEQARMRALLCVPQKLPPALEARRIALRERLLRSEALAKAGAKSSESAAAHRARIEVVWRQMLDNAKIDDATRAYWRLRLAEDASRGIPAKKE